MSEILTPNLGLPLPHETLEVDLPRLQQAFSLLDTAVAANRSAITGAETSFAQQIAVNTALVKRTRALALMGM